MRVRELEVIGYWLLGKRSEVGGRKEKALNPKHEILNEERREMPQVFICV
jgi:hypothetical protein